MTCKVTPSKKVRSIFKKMKTKDRSRFEQISKKLIELGENPEIGKPLGYDLKGLRRFHIGHYVLTYFFDEDNNEIILEDYDHHDNVYK
jgi:mRNA-degrading endonuclease RelE of RelBE toxin-antitoxin system